MDGFICIDKPVGPSSFAAIRAVKKSLKAEKIGHAGTLDPMASGLLVVALGKCTKLLRYLSLEPKVYEFTTIFGASTDTLDAAGAVVAESGVVPDEGRLSEIIKSFAGDITQVPPKYSAIKIGGVPAYKLARKGDDVEIKPRTVHVYSIETRGYDSDKKRAEFTVSCSAGTYVRTLAADIAAAAGALGHVGALRRTRTGRFDLSMATDVQSGGAANYIISAWDAFDGQDRVIITEEQIAQISFGRNIALDKRESATLIAFDAARSLSAVLRNVGGNIYHPDKVF